MKNDYPMIPQERSDDIHNIRFLENSHLNLFMAGNQFMVMSELIESFQEEHPEIKKIFYETLPPGLEFKQIMSGGAIFKGKLINIVPDIYTSVNEKTMIRLEEAGKIEKGTYRLYLHNRLTLMVPKGNPGGIAKVADLGRDDIRISQPDPANEDIAFHIMDMYKDAGGDELVYKIMERKRALGTTVFTIVHHRETPLRIEKRTVDVGPVWATEVICAKNNGMNFDVVEPGEDLDQRDKINYYICQVKKGQHPENGKKFMDFILSPKARKIYEKYGFISGFKA